MPGVLHPPLQFWQVHQPPAGPAAPGASHRPARSAQSTSGAEHWRSHVFAVSAAPGKRRHATRYEKFTTRMVLLSSVLTLGITMYLHLANYDLETKTSSTSGTHSTFYKADE